MKNRILLALLSIACAACGGEIPSEAPEAIDSVEGQLEAASTYNRGGVCYNLSHPTIVNGGASNTQIHIYDSHGRYMFEGNGWWGGTTNTIETYGLESFTTTDSADHAANKTVYAARPGCSGTRCGAPGQVWLYQLNARPSINTACQAGNGGRPAAEYAGARSYWPRPIPGWMHYNGVSVVGDYTFRPYGALAGGPIWTGTQWSLPNVSAGGGYRRFIQDWEPYWVQQVNKVTMPSYNCSAGVGTCTTSNQYVNGWITFIYVRLVQNGQNVYTWVVESHSESASGSPAILHYH
jgi:hypothetical protein